MADTSLVHGAIMHIHELQALGPAAVGRSVRVLGKCVLLLIEPRQLQCRWHRKQADAFVRARAGWSTLMWTATLSAVSTWACT